MRTMKRLTAALLLVGTGVVAQAEQPSSATDALIFAGGDLTFESFTTVSDGDVVVNGNVHHGGGSLNVDSLFAGGGFTRDAAAFQNATGDLLFGGSISEIGGPGSTLDGNITSGGSVVVEGSTVVGGNVTVADNFDLPFSFGVVLGDVTAGGDVNIDGEVDGLVTHGGVLTVGAFGDVASSASGGPVVPTPYTPLSLPAGSGLVSTGDDVDLANFADITLTPGNYGTLNFASANTVTLTAGQYVFQDIVSTFSLNQLSFDTSAGPIDIFVDGDLTLDLVQVLNGVELFTTGRPDPLDALDVTIEVAGSFTGDSKFFGTIFAPNGDITLNHFADITGSLWAGGDIVLGNVDVTSPTVPEPASVVCVALAGAAIGMRRRRA